MSLSAASILLLASSAIAGPIIRRELTGNPDNATDFDQICGHGDVSSFALAKEVWEQTAAGYHIDSYIKNVKGGNADNWVNHMYLWTFGEDGGLSPMDSCGSLVGCNQDLNCSQFFDKGRAGYYWILKGVEGLHDKFADIHDRFQSATIQNILLVDDMKTDFAEPPPTGGLASFISAAFVIGAGAVGVAGASGPVGGLMTVIVGIMGAITAAAPEKVDKNSAKQTLLNMFNSTEPGFVNTLSLATGNTQGGDYNSLPSGGFNEYDSPVANFFSGSDVLTSLNAEDYKNTIDAGFKQLNAKLLDVSLQAANVRVMAELGESKCDGKGDRFLADIDGGRCFHLMRGISNSDEPGVHCGKPGDGKCKTEGFSDAEYDKLANKYSFDLESYYRNAYACEVSGLDDVDMDNLPFDGSIPTCYFNPRTFKGTIVGKLLEDWENFEKAS